jgi:hypothetical protein
MKNEDQPALDARLHQLPPPTQDPAIAARSLRHARALYLATHQSDLPARLWRIYLGAEPVLVASIAVVYLDWAFRALASLWR